MLENPVSSLAEKQNPAFSQLLAITQMVTPIARLWCRSFGIADGQAIARLAQMLSNKVQDELAAGMRMNLIQSRFDETAAEIIRNWFSFVLGRDIPEDSKSLAILRLAFLDANYDGSWSSVFLKREFCVQELSSELEAMMIEPTPVAAPRPMLRQVF